MALPKRVKVGGSFYKGYVLTVGAAPGDYVLDMTLANHACTINGITIISSENGSGDYYKLEHLDANNELVDTLAETVYNFGAGTAWHFDFSALELMEPNHKFRLTYTNVAGVAMSIYTTLERIR